MGNASIGDLPGPQSQPIHSMFVHLFSKHWELFQPKLPLGLGVTCYSRMFFTSVEGWRDLDLGRSAHLLQGCWYSRAHFPGDVKEGIWAPEKGTSPRGFGEYSQPGQTRRKKEGKPLVLASILRIWRCQQWALLLYPDSSAVGPSLHGHRDGSWPGPCANN